MNRTEATRTQQSETDRVKHIDGDIRQQLDEPMPIFGDLTTEDIDRQRQLERLFDCVTSIRKSRDKLNLIDRHQHGYELSGPEIIPLWMDIKGERGILRKQNMERRHRLLGQALANLLDVISCEIGNSAVDKTLYPENYDSVELGRVGEQPEKK